MLCFSYKLAIAPLYISEADLEYTPNIHPDMDPNVAYWITEENIVESWQTWLIGNFYAYVQPR